MKYIFLLSKQNIDLSKEEVLALTNAKDYKLISNLLILNIKNKATINKLSKRLACTKAIYQLLFISNAKKLTNDLNSYNWNSIYKKDFCVRLTKPKGFNHSEKELGSIIWNKIKNPRVNLVNPKTKIELFIIKNKIMVALLAKELKQDFEQRKAHKRPELHPTSLNPKLARCLINLSGIGKGTLVDLFCGSGGILIEAGLIGLNVIGYDLYNIMLKKAKINLDYYKIKKYRLINKDALRINKRYDYIVTDPPYGLNTSVWISENNINKKIPLKQINKKEKKRNLERFYNQLLSNLRRIAKKKVVIIFPHYVNYKGLIKKNNFIIEKEFSQFIHRSLTRKIVVLV